MMGWRVGYIAYPDPDGKDMIGAQLLKCQDTVGGPCAGPVSRTLSELPLAPPVQRISIFGDHFCTSCAHTMQICICATQLSQRVALAALQHGQQYKQEKIASLEGGLQGLLSAYSGCCVSALLAAPGKQARCNESWLA